MPIGFQNLVLGLTNFIHCFIPATFPPILSLPLLNVLNTLNALNALNVLNTLNTLNVLNALNALNALPDKFRVSCRIKQIRKFSSVSELDLNHPPFAVRIFVYDFRACFKSGIDFYNFP